ncbi:MAG: adenylosuccinate lyase [Planctomycetota bacterium]
METYESPLSGRYASTDMKALWSPAHKARLWRRLWLHLAESQQELGLSITDTQLEQMRAHLDDVDLADIAVREKELRHDVMAHLHSFGALCPDAKGILHLGATSAFIQDNADQLLLREAMELTRRRLVNAIAALREFAAEWAGEPTLGYTHFQPAQPTTVGKRATLWLQDFVTDLSDLERTMAEMPFRGAKGTTGTQASYLTLFEGDGDKVRRLDALVTKRAGFETSVAVCGQTLSRKEDARIANAVSGIALSAHKLGNDLRLLQHLGEIEEPFGKSQIGSSAMAFKRNPMRAERMCALSRFAITCAQNPAYTAATQWFERTLDDSANRRLSMPELFLTIDGVLQLVLDVGRGLVVHPKVIQANLKKQLPFLVTETLLMDAVKAGGDRQELHEQIRVHSRAAADRLKEGAADNDLFERLRGDAAFAGVADLLATELDARNFTGRAEAQVGEFLAEFVDPLLREREGLLGGEAEVNV